MFRLNSSLRLAVVATGIVMTTALSISPASADTITQVNAYSPGGSIVAAAKFREFSGTNASDWCVKAVNSGHAVAYLKFPGGATESTDEWGGDSDWKCSCPAGLTDGVQLKLSVEYWLANGTRYAYSDVVTFTG